MEKFFNISNIGGYSNSMGNQSCENNINKKLIKSHLFTELYLFSHSRRLIAIACARHIAINIATYDNRGKRSRSLFRGLRGAGSFEN